MGAGHQSGDMRWDDPRMLLAFPEAWTRPEDIPAARRAKQRVVRELVASGAHPDFNVQAYCPHLDTVPVDLAASGEIVATLCVDCDAQLPARPPPTRSED